MRRYVGWFLVVIALDWSGSGVHAAERDPSAQSFLNDYHEAMKKILHVYGSMRMDCTQVYPSNYQKAEETWQYARQAGSMRWVEVDPKTGGGYALVFDADQSFKLTRESGSSQYVVKRIADTGSKALRSYAASIEVRTAPAFAPYQAYVEEPLDRFLSEPLCTIKSIVREGQPPNRLIRVEWEIAPSEPKHKARFGMFEILPDAGWVLRSYAIYSKDGYKDKETGRTYDVGRGGDLEYEGKYDGIPLIRRLSTWTSAKKKGEGPTYEVTRIEPGPVPHEEFTLASFGIDTSPVAARIPIAYPLLALSAACMAGVLLIWYLRNRSERRAQGASS